jgi:hypothetical protein
MLFRPKIVTYFLQTKSKNEKPLFRKRCLRGHVLKENGL